MKKFYLVIFILFLSIQISFAQSINGVVSFDVPAKSTLKFNKYLINPTFSFVREDIPTLSLFNKRQWSGFENAPTTYFLNYSGKFQENNAFSAGAFQQNYGLLTTTGGLINYARNVMFDEESNLTFGLNIAFYKSGINTSKIITNTVDPLLNNFGNNTILAINPGINYGIGFLDFGFSANNLVLYNLANSQNVALDPEKSFQGHIMYTGFIESNGYFDESKFTTLLRAETKKTTEITANFLFEKPSLGWVQGGYNNVYGVSAGLGFNINQNISLGYNFERGLGNLSSLGNSHEFVLAYVFNEWEERSDGTGPTYTKPVASVPKVDPAIAAAEKARIEKERLEKEKAIAQAKFDAYAAAKAKVIEDAKAKELSDAAKAKAFQEAKAKSIADAKIKAELDALSSAERAKAIAQAKIKADADAKAKLESEKAQAIINAKARALANANNAKDAAAAKLKADADAKAAFEAQRIANLKSIADAKAKTAAEANELAKANAEKLKAENLRKAQEKAEADARAKLATEKQKAEAARLSKQKAEDDAKANAENIANAKSAADNAKAEALKRAKEKAEAENLLKENAKAKADAALLAKQEADKLKAEANRIASEKAATDLKAKTEADKILKDKLALENKAKADAALLAKQEADKLKAEANRIASEKAAADLKTKTEADKILKDKLALENKAKADAALLAKQEADKLKVEANRIASEKAAADLKAKTEAKEKLAADAKAALEAKARLESDKLKAIADAKAKAEADVKNKAEAEKQKLIDAAKAKADAEAERIRKVEESRKADLNKSDADKSLDYVKNLLDQNKKIKDQSLARLDSIANSRLNDLKDLKEENDLGIAKAPKAFVSASAQNKALENLKNELLQSSKTQSEFLAQYQDEYNKRLLSIPNKDDATNKKYAADIEKLKAEQAKSELAKNNLLTKLDQIKIDIDIEKKRRIRRAAVETGQGRFELDRASLKKIKETTTPSTTPLTSADFDFGDPESNNQILKKIENTQSGYYLVLAAHNSVAKRDAFLTKVVSAGLSTVDFFFDINTGKYYVFTKKYDSLDESSNALESKGNKPYNGKMFVVKIEN
jgi:type IX secretion system PorP/SprF family membrane protein